MRQNSAAVAVMHSRSTAGKSKVIKVEAQTLRVHPHAQRALSPARLKLLTETLDLDAIGVLHCVEYSIDGELALWIIDGQHRWRALMENGMGEWVVEVKVHITVKDDARASELFLMLNNRAVVSPFDKFENSRKAGHADAVGITKIAAAHQLRVSRSSEDGHLACVSALMAAYHFDDGKTLAATLDALIAAWGRTAAACEGKVIEGVALLLKTYSETVEHPMLVKKLAKYPGGPSRLIGDARGLRSFRNVSIARCVAERVIELYNSGRKTGRLDPL